jgi:hypothetical protein
LIGNNLALFSTFFQGLNFDLNQKQTLMLTMFNRGENGKNHVNDMCIKDVIGYRRREKYKQK